MSLYRRTTRRRRLWMLAVLMAYRYAAAEVRAYQMRPFLLGEYDRVVGHGTPFNAEPHKCGGIAWYPSNALPANTVPYTMACVDLVRRGAQLTLHGWD
ncbi:MAG: hypothetical protein ACRDT8_23215 [Micromonosporaceae bacterium]